MLNADIAQIEPFQDFKEQGYLWLCAKCENHPKFETIYELFRHKKTHAPTDVNNVEKNQNKQDITESTVDKSSHIEIETPDEDALSKPCDNFSKGNEEQNEGHNLSESETEVPCLNSPTPSDSSEDIPLSSLVSNSQKVKTNKLTDTGKGTFKKQKVKTGNRRHNTRNKKEKKAVPDENKHKNEKVLQEDHNVESLKEEKENEKINESNCIDTKPKEVTVEEEKEVKNESKDDNSKPKLKHICKICNVEFPSRVNLTMHKKTHLFQDTGCYKCETCGKMCPKYDNFTRHLTIHFSNREKTHQCTQCDSSFYNLADLKRHLVLHLAVKPYKCEHCGEGFIRQDNLLIHAYKHTGIQYKKFSCKDCDKVLNSPSALVMHVKTHSVKTVFCPEEGCKFSCYLQSQLRQHLRKHSGEKPFQCAKCGRCFARSNDMKNHVLNVHEGVKPYKCSFCPKEFALIGNLRIHKITHTNERPFLCAQCGKCFNQSSTLRKHSIIMHNPWRTNKPKRSKKRFSMSGGAQDSDNKLMEETKNRGRLKEPSPSQSKSGKVKQKKIITPNIVPDVIYVKSGDIPKDKCIVTNAANITNLSSSIRQEISTSVQTQVPQITVTLPIQLDHSQAFILPTVILEPELLRNTSVT